MKCIPKNDFLIFMLWGNGYKYDLINSPNYLLWRIVGKSGYEHAAASLSGNIEHIHLRFASSIQAMIASCK